MFHNTEIDQDPCIEPRKLRNVRVSIHGDKILSKKIESTNFLTATEVRKQKFMKKKPHSICLHTLKIYFQIKVF